MEEWAEKLLMAVAFVGVAVILGIVPLPQWWVNFVVYG